MPTHNKTSFDAVLQTFAFNGPEVVFVVDLVYLGVQALHRTEPLIGLAFGPIQTGVESAVLTVVVVIGLIDHFAADVVYSGTGVARQVGCARVQVDWAQRVCHRSESRIVVSYQLGRLVSRGLIPEYITSIRM